MAEYPPAPEEIEASDSVIKILDAFDDHDITMKLGHIDDIDKQRVPSEITSLMRRYRNDILRVKLALLLVAEAEAIRRSWASYLDTRNAVNSRRYADLLFSARAMLPPAFPWDRVTYLHLDHPVPWSHQLLYDGDGDLVIDMTYNVEAAQDLMAEHKTE